MPKSAGTPSAGRLLVAEPRGCVMIFVAWDEISDDPHAVYPVTAYEIDT